MNRKVEKAYVLPPWYKAHDVTERDAMILQVQQDYEVLEGPDVVEILRCIIAGARTTSAIQDRLACRFSGADLRGWLDTLEEEGFLVEHVPDLSAAERTVTVQLEVPPKQVANALRTTSVALKTYGVDEKQCREALDASGIHVSSTADQADRMIVIAHNYLDARLRTFNRESLQSGRPWMLIKPVGKEPFVGPIIHPGTTPCWECLASRLRENDRIGQFLESAGRRSVSPRRENGSPTTSVVVHMAVWELVKWIVLGENVRLEGQLLSVDPDIWDSTVHPVARVQRCVACGTSLTPEDRRPSPLVLKPRKRGGKVKNSHRALEAEETYRRHAHLIDPHTGPFRNLQRLQVPLGDLIHVYTVEHPLVAVTDTLEKLYINEHSVSGGKGSTDAEARTSALFEAIERYSSVWRGDEFRGTASYDELRVSGAIHPYDLLGFSRRQYQERDVWNATHLSAALYVPEPFDEAKPIEWVKVWSMSKRAWRYVPAAFGYFGYPRSTFCVGDTNGNASGTTIEEAVLQGLLELVERDAVAIWFYNRLHRPGVDLHSFSDHPYFTEVQTLYRKVLGREVWVLDVTSDLGIPTVVAVSRQVSAQADDILLGFGAHLDVRIAIYRALTEMAQSLPGARNEVSGNDTTYRPALDPKRREWLYQTTVEHHTYFAPDAEQPAKTVADFPSLSSDDLLKDVQTCVKRLEERGLEVCVLNLTREDLGVPVVKVIAPGMVHWWRRLGYTRLYRVPVRMGWIEEPLDEDAVNPLSLVL